MTSPISADLAAIDGLAGDLGVLGAELTDDAEVCSSCASSMGTALEGVHGEEAVGTGRAWALLIGELGARAAAAATVLRSAVAAYLAADGTIAGRVDGRPETTRGPR